MEHHVTLLREVLSRIEGTEGADDSLKHAASIQMAEDDEEDPVSAMEQTDIGALWHSRRIQQTLRAMLQGSEESVGDGAELSARERALLELLLLERLSPELSIDDILHETMELIQEVFDCEQVRFFFPLDTASQQVALWNSEFPENSVTVNWAGMIAHVAESKQPCLIDDESDHLHPDPQIDAITGVTTQRMLAVPVLASPRSISGDEAHERSASDVLAVAALVNPRSGRRFTRRHEQALVAVCFEIEQMLREKEAELAFLQGSAAFVSSTTCREAFTIALNHLEVNGPISLLAPAKISGKRPSPPRVVSVKVSLLYGTENLVRPWISSRAKLQNVTKARASTRAVAADSSSAKASGLPDDDAEDLDDDGRRSLQYRADFVGEWALLSISIKDLPRAVVLQLTVISVDGSPVAFAKFPLFGSDSVLQGKSQTVPLVADNPENHVRQNRMTGPRNGGAPLRLSITTEKFGGRHVIFGEPTATLETARENASKLEKAALSGSFGADDGHGRKGGHGAQAKGWRFLREMHSRAKNTPTSRIPLNHFFMTAEQKELDRIEQKQERLEWFNFEALPMLRTVINRDLLHQLTEDERHQIWVHRYKLTHIPKALPKLMLTINWGFREQVQEAYHLLKQWAPLEPHDALQLLSLRFPDPKVRAHGVRWLSLLDDEELAQMTLQLVQVVKFEQSHDTALNRFLLRRALMSPPVCGHALFWALHVEREVEDRHHNCRVLLEIYVRNSGRYRVAIGHQMFVVNKLTQVVTAVKEFCASKDEHGDPNVKLREKLKDLVLPRSFQLPLSPHMECKGLIIEKCKVMGSKMKPLWLTFQPLRAGVDPYVVIFKSGDDLRQDRLTLQLLQTMEQIWREAGLELDMSVYGCVSTAPAEGMLQVVQNANTLAGIAAQHGGGDRLKSGSISRKLSAAREAYAGSECLIDWLKRENEAPAGDVADTSATADRGSNNVKRPRNRNSVSRQSYEQGVSNGSVSMSFRSLPATVSAGVSSRSSPSITTSARPWEEKPAEFENPLAQSSKLVEALDHFTRSSAAYCVATFVLGIGDRHNDNIMLTRDGRLFHIDFGHFLGHFKKKGIGPVKVRREKAPFVFTPHFARVLGGQLRGSRFRQFEELCCRAFLALRQQKDLIMTLLLLMVDCGIPELKTIDDVRWVSSALLLDQTDDEATASFMALIGESLDCKTTRIMHAIHNIAHT